MKAPESVRLRHRTLRGVVVTVPDITRPMTPNGPCPTCGVPHPCKTYHLVLDSEGAVVVSPGVWAGLQRANSPDLSVESSVKDPPHQTLGLGTPTMHR